MKKMISVLLLAVLLAGVCRAAEDNDMITFLSDMEWTGAEIYSGANGGVPSRDENVAGEELWLYDKYFEKGVCLHAAPGKISYIEVNIENKGFTTFYTYVGTAESELYDVSMASVRFVFKVDGQAVKRVGPVTPKKRPELITFDVTGAKTLRIEMDDGGDGISGDWGALGSALFSTSSDVDEISAALLPETEPVTEPVTEQQTEPSQTEQVTEPETEQITEKAAETEALTEEIKPEEKKSFPLIPVIAVAAAAAAVIAVLIAKKRKKN